MTQQLPLLGGSAVFQLNTDIIDGIAILKIWNALIIPNNLPTGVLAAECPPSLEKCRGKYLF
jgi:hypothetical protein